MTETILYEDTVATPVVSTVFSDGIVVNADDLETAMLYPLELIQVLIRAYFGCGIVCGLRLGKSDNNCEVVLEPGVALNCHGYPLRLCRSVPISLTPDPCAEEGTSQCVCIAISRCATPNGSGECITDSTATSQSRFTRQTEAVRVKAFSVEQCDNCDELPKNLCIKRTNTNGEAESTIEYKEDSFSDPSCTCLTRCSPECCGESWVHIGCVTLNSVGGISDPDYKCRQYVKPIACQCVDANNDSSGDTAAAST